MALCICERLEQLIDFLGVLQNIVPLETPPVSCVFFLVVFFNDMAGLANFLGVNETGVFNVGAGIMCGTKFSKNMPSLMPCFFICIRLYIHPSLHPAIYRPMYVPI